MKVLRRLLPVLIFAVGAIVHAEPTETEKPPPKLEPIQVGTPQKIEILPASIQLGTPSRKVQVIVSGFYADGRVQDLTRAAEYKIAMEGVAKISTGSRRQRTFIS